MKVLLGLGGGEDGFRALSRTLTRTADAGDDLTVVIVENPEAPADRSEIETRVRTAIAESPVDAEVRTLTGDPGSRIVEIAEVDGFDSIVIGGGELSPLGKITLGSITEFVVLNATVSVTLVR